MKATPKKKSTNDIGQLLLDFATAQRAVRESMDTMEKATKALAGAMDKAPDMLAALRAIAARVAEDRATVESLGYCYTDSAEEDCADIAREAIEALSSGDE